MKRHVLGPVPHTDQRGFSLVELMVVITIIGILAGIAIPKFQTFRARAQQTEAKSGLNAVFLSAQAYEANYGEYPLEDGNPLGPTDYAFKITEIGFATGGNRQRYEYSFLSEETRWVAMAKSEKALNDGKFDYFRINTNKWLCQPWDAVTGVAPRDGSGKSSATSGNMCPQAFDGSDDLLPDFSGCADWAIGSAEQCE